MKKYKVWYMKPEFFRDGIMGPKWLAEKGMLPDPNNLGKTHIYLKKTGADGLEDLYMKMQGEVWSPNGEARGLINSRGLRHTSMSVGDIAVDWDGVVMMVDSFGFKEIGRMDIAGVAGYARHAIEVPVDK